MVVNSNYTEKSVSEADDLLYVLAGEHEAEIGDILDIGEQLDYDSHDPTKWDQALKNYEEKLDSNSEGTGNESEDKKTVSTVFKIYHQILSRFPYYSKYWKDWSIFAYKSKGIDTSIKVLERAVSQHPYSIDLWSDYLAALITQYESTEDEQKKEKAIEHLRLQYNYALNLNAYNFNSHHIWDKVFHLESSVDPVSKTLLSLYSRAIRIPLYQYSLYFERFSEISKHFDVNVTMEEGELESYLSKFDRGSASELSLIEKQQILDDYSFQIFNKTQNAVNEKWEFESTIQTHEFSLDELANVNAEFLKWIKYLRFDISKYRSNKDEASLKSVFNLFERFLIPNCLNKDAWFHYLSFINSSELSHEEKFEKLREVYTRAINKFISLDQPKLSMSYVDFLTEFDKSEMAIDYLLDMIKLASGSNKSKIYLKSSYIRGLEKLLNIWKNSMKPNSYVELLKILIDDYFADGSSNAKRHENSKTENERREEMDQALAIYKDVLGNLFNDNASCLVVLSYLTELRIQPSSQASTIRTFFNKHHKKGIFKNSGKFWLFFIEYEGLVQKNMQNLEAVIHYTKTQTQLPKIVIDSLIGVYKDILSSNFHLGLAHHSVLDSYLMIDNDTSSSMILNSSMKERAALNNSIIRDMETQKSLKHNPSFNKKEEFVKLLMRQGSHPGIISDPQPEITNSILFEFTRISLTEDNFEMPSLPCFKNVEKANLPLNQPSE